MYGAPPPQQGYPPQGAPPQGAPPQQYGAPPPGGYPPQQYSGVPPAGGAGMPNMPGAPTPGNDPCRQWFDSVDTDRSGSIGPGELQQAMSRAGYQFNQKAVDRMMRMYDKDNSGQISFMEFRQMYDFINRMSSGFRSRDTDGSGRLEGHEVRAALAASGYQLSEGTFQLLMKKFDAEQAGGLRFDDYIELSCMLGALRNIFAFHDRQRTGQVSFNFDSFMTAAMTAS